MKRNPFHCCATCKHFQVTKRQSDMAYLCERLGYETKPAYTFNCWNPKEHVLTLMKKRNEEK
jgi:hypothetical protein